MSQETFFGLSTSLIENYILYSINTDELNKDFAKMEILFESFPLTVNFCKSCYYQNYYFSWKVIALEFFFVNYVREILNSYLI